MYTKPSKSIVQQKIHDKIFDEAFKMIVKEAYLHSLVYDINQAEEGSLEALMRYSDACCDHLGCRTLLESAIASQPTGPKKTFLMDIYKVCESTATEISTRATEGSKSTDQFDDVPLEELVRTAGFTKGEFKKFQNKVDSLGMDEIGGIIQNKVRDVLKQEHDDQVRIDTINKELTDVVNQNNKEREEAKADMQPDDLDNGQFDEDEDLDDVGEADKTDEEAPTDGKRMSFCTDCVALPKKRGVLGGSTSVLQTKIREQAGLHTLLSHDCVSLVDPVFDLILLVSTKVYDILYSFQMVFCNMVLEIR